MRETDQVKPVPSIGGVVLVCVLTAAFMGTSAHAAEVEWLVDSHGLWHQVSNWSSDPGLPGPTDNVTIDRPAADITVIHSLGTTAINDLSCNESLRLTGGSLTVSGTGLISGAFTIGPGASLTADGAGATITAVGVTSLNGGSFYALNGGNLGLPNATSYAATDVTNPYFTADGAGSTLDLSTFTTILSSTIGAEILSIQAHNGGKVDLSGTTSFTTFVVQVVADGAVSVVDLSAVTALGTNSYYYDNYIKATNGGTVVMGNLTALDDTEMVLDGTGTVNTSQITDFTNGLLTLDGAPLDVSNISNVTGTEFRVTGVHLDLTHLTALSRNTIRLNGGATADLSTITTVDAASFFVADGVTLTVPNATSYVATTGQNSWPYFKAYGTGSVLDLSTFTTVSPSTSGGEILYIQAYEGGKVDLSGTTSCATSQVKVLADGTGSVVDMSAMGSFSAVSPVGASRIEARNGGTVLLNPGTTVVTDTNVVVTTSGTISVGTLSLADQSKLTGTGTLNGSVLNSSGVTSPGISVGELTVDGTYTQAAGGTLLIELAALSKKSDVLAVTGDLWLGGTLEINPLDGFSPENNWSYTILTADGDIHGEFDSLAGPVRSIAYNDHDVVVTSTYMGDANLDMIVDDIDLAILLSNWTISPVDWRRGDFTGDGRIDDGDLSIILSNWTGSPPAAGPPIPEPATLALLAAGALLSLRRRKGSSGLRPPTARVRHLRAAPRLSRPGCRSCLPRRA